MFSRGFNHNGIKYEFKWAKREAIINNMPVRISKPLILFFNQIYNKDLPHYLFNNPKIHRCSKFRIKGLKRGIRKEISDILIEREKIIPFTIENYQQFNIPSSIAQILSQTEEVFADYENLNYKPSHDEVLSYILLRNNNAISVETPVWTRKQASLTDYLKKNDHLKFTCKVSITGHIDLLLYNPKNLGLIVCDYKPEGYFLLSLPQVATYGLLLKRILRISEITCISFKRDLAWVYNPDILPTEIENLLKKFGDPILAWRNMIKMLY